MKLFNQKIKSFKPKQKISKALLLVIPFIALALLLIILPMILILVKSFIPTSSGSIVQNWNYINSYVWYKILKTLISALIATLFCIIIGYPFSYFLSFNNTKIFKMVVLIVVTAPIWTSFLVKLIGLKTFFDVMNGYANSTYGEIFTIIGLTYVYLPFMIIPLFNVLDELPRNLIFASKDLGQTSLSTFRKIVLPYSRTALIAGITLVFLPAVTTVAVSQFLNNSPNGANIGSIIVEEGEQALTNELALSRASTLSLIVSIVILLIYGILSGTPKLFDKIKQSRIRGKINA